MLATAKQRPPKNTASRGQKYTPSANREPQPKRQFSGTDWRSCNQLGVSGEEEQQQKAGWGGTWESGGM